MHTHNNTQDMLDMELLGRNRSDKEKHANGNNDSSELHPKEEHETKDQDVHNATHNNDDTEEHKSESYTGADTNLQSSSQSSEFEKESLPEQPLRSDVEQQIVLNERRSSCLQRRRTIVDKSLLKSIRHSATIVNASDVEEDEPQTSESPRDFLRVICLNPKFGLHTQLLLTFGSVSFFIILFVSITSMIVAWETGEKQNSINERIFRDLVEGNLGNSARYFAESLTTTLIPEDAVRILHESVRDRFAGYPNDDDEFVPFRDVDSKTNKYPVVGVTRKPLPLDWEIDSYVNDDNHEEHVQGRWSWYKDKGQPPISTASAFYSMQGMCDPSVDDPSVFTYWENCTAANNDVSTGGVVAPTPTNYQIYRKSSSLTPILKAVYESHPDIRDMGIYFSNSGAGAGLTFPHHNLQTNIYYTSIGCEWMEKPNPYDPSRPIGTKEEIQICNPEGTNVSLRLYNNLESPWCRNQALDPSRTLVDGPTFDPWTNVLRLSAGQGIYDRVTNDFIGCIFVGLQLDNVQKVISGLKFTKNSEVSVARFDDGTIVASTLWNSSGANDTFKVYDLNLGLPLESYEELKTLVDYNALWDPRDVIEKYKTLSLNHDDFLVKISPIPPVPESYDPNYIPLFFAMLSASEKDIFKVIDDVEDRYQKAFIEVVYISFIVGVIGIAIVLLIIYLMSKALTAPLEYMNSAADKIINHFGSTTSSSTKPDIINPTPGYHCFPRTELDELVEEFNRMVTSFSGRFASTVNPVNDVREEIPNKFYMREDFDDLYKTREEVKFGYRMGKTVDIGAGSTKFIHLGSNMYSTEAKPSTQAQRSSVRRDMQGKGGLTSRLFSWTVLLSTQRKAQKSVKGDTQGKGGLTSRLFFWTVLLSGTPLLWTTIAISGTMMYKLSNEFDSALDEIESLYLKVRKNGLSVQSHVVSSGTSRPIRDLHLLTRYASWLLFDAVERTESFTQVKTGIEQCKKFSDEPDCPFYEENYFCDCAWNERGSTCDHYTNDTRYRQDLYFICEASDTFSNGDRNSTSFPKVSDSPENTVWWNDIATLPGSEKGASASGYETTYDRLRVVSASPVHQVVYNADVEKDFAISSGIAFDADGLYMSFRGCNKTFVENAKWSSSEANGANILQPDLCPLGKYGYDPRCHEWYHTGKTLAEVNGTPLHVTSPYIFSSSGIGQSATSPLIDPQTKAHVGQVVIDFISGPMLNSFVDKNTFVADGSFPILITTSPGPDSVIGPVFSLLNESAKPISELVMPHDHNCTKEECMVRIGHFEQIVSSMKAGESKTTNFTRLLPTGYEETVYITYAPIFVTTYSPLNSSDFARGVKSQDVLIYSLALAQTKGKLLRPFQQIKEANNKQVKKSIAVFSVIILLSILFAMYIISVVTLSVIGPILVLLDIINSINRRDFNEEPPSINRSNGSREVISFTNTIQTLYKVALSANYAFFSGDLERAYTVLHDASQLFHTLDNNKAVGVVSNNLGNLLLDVFREMNENDEEHFCNMTKADVINKGMSLFFDAIQIGEQAYDELNENDRLSASALDFMQHLSNMYFNRGIFLLTVKDGHGQADELEKLGYRDLDISIDFDTEIADLGLKQGDVTYMSKKFELTLMRAKRYLTLQEMGYPDTWDVDEMLDNAFLMVRNGIKIDGSELFQTTSEIGRLQEVEALLIRYNLLKGKVRLAAQIGIRMLVEDEYLFLESQDTALEALSAVYFYELLHNDDDEEENDRKSMRHSRLKEYRSSFYCDISEEL